MGPAEKAGPPRNLTCASTEHGICAGKRGGFKVYEKVRRRSRRLSRKGSSSFPCRHASSPSGRWLLGSAAANRLIAEERLRKMPNDDSRALLRRAKTMNDEELDKVRTLCARDAETRHA